MAKIAVNESTIAESTIENHINYTMRELTGYTEEYCTRYDDDGYCTRWGGGDPIYSDIPYELSAKINGTCTATSTTVKINGKAPVLVGDKTKESDTYSLPSGGKYVSGSHTGSTSGSVTVGNQKNVFVGGKLIAISGSTVKTHAGNETTVTGALSTTVNIGT